MNMKRNILIVLATIAFVLPASALNMDFQNTLPETSFRSTSAMSGIGSAYSSMPALNADGTATYEGATYSAGPRKAPPPTPEGDPTPIGDGTWILMLLAAGYALFIAWRRKVVKR